MNRESSERARITGRLHNKNDWRELVTGNVDAIQLKSFATRDECAEILTFVDNHPYARPYKTASGILRLGTSLSDILRAGQGAVESGMPDILEQSLMINGVIPRMIGYIVASWPCGLETYSYRGKPLHRSIVRRILKGGAEPHDDNVTKDIEDPTGAEVQLQFGANLYVEIPAIGGELEGWHKRLSTEEYNRLRHSGPSLSYGIRRDAIGPCDWAIKPSVGDFIIFNNSELHAIRPSAQPRTTWGFFLGYRGDDSPLLIWS